ncbi:MAG: alpha/beta hydrolase [Moraxellaceae bacterium]|nr:alpha/beta hydrolase [Moraxellaceae bacterium]MDZ4298207.1 alpha/beta hydrolase [Moraxellaceae bacterium]MDZ4386873.1 alpha/beta hydrolase [Moraxellaceae bacterium]
MTHDAIQPRRRVSHQAYVLNWAVAALIRPVSWVASIGSPTAMHNIRRVFSLTKPLLSSLPKSTVITPFKAPNLKGEWVMAANARDSRKVILYFHGGGYFFGNPQQHRQITSRLSQITGRRVLSLDYRLAPEFSFNHWTTDALTAYRYLLGKGYNGHDILISGDSAGGHLSLVLLQMLKERHMPLPQAAILLSPWTDLSHTSESMHDKEWRDPMIPAAAVQAVANYLTVGQDPMDYRVSPIHGDFVGLPPLFVAIGSTEVLREDCRRMIKKARQSGVKVHYEEWHRMVHVFPLFSAVLPEGRLLFEHIGRFVSTLDSLQDECVA